MRWRTRPDNQAEIDVYQKASDAIDAQLEGITLVYEPGGSETSSYQDVLKTEIAAGTAPDVFWIPGTDVADFATRGLILNLDDLAVPPRASAWMTSIRPDVPPDLQPGDAASQARQRRPVGPAPRRIDLRAVPEPGPDRRSRRSRPARAGREGEWTWDAFLDVAQTVRALGSDIYGYGANAWWGPYGVWMNCSRWWFLQRRPHRLRARHARIAGRAWSSSAACTRTTMWPCPTAKTASRPSWPAGRHVPERPLGHTRRPRQRETSPGTWLSCRPARRALGNWLFWGAYVVNANTEHPEEAWKLVQALTTAEIQGMISELGTNIPSRVSQEALDAFLTFTPPDNNQAFLNGLPTTRSPKARCGQARGLEFDAVMGPAVASVLTGENRR